jgi:hypothetical protein
MKYTGQTGRPFRIRFQEHIGTLNTTIIDQNSHNTIDNKYAIGNMEDIMEIVHVTGKGKKLDSLEGFHI